MKKHRHEYHALWGHFGPYGDQDKHFHPCRVEGCGAWLVGDERDCGGPGTPHRVDLGVDAGDADRARGAGGGDGT